MNIRDLLSATEAEQRLDLLFMHANSEAVLNLYASETSAPALHIATHCAAWLKCLGTRNFCTCVYRIRISSIHFLKMRACWCA